MISLIQLARPSIPGISGNISSITSGNSGGTVIDPPNIPSAISRGSAKRLVIKSARATP